MLFIKKLPPERLELIITILSVISILSIPQYGVILSFILVIVYLRRSKNRNELRQSIGLKQPKNTAILIILSAFMGIAIELAMEILVDDSGNVTLFGVWIIIGFVLGGLLEEILFRGFLITRISKFIKVNKFSDLISLFITSILFGLCHLYQGLSGAISTGIIGLIFGIIFLSFNKNLWYSILTHGFVNLTSLTILYFGYYEKLKSLLF